MASIIPEHAIDGKVFDRYVMLMRNAKVVVIGGSSGIGRGLVQALLELDAEVTAMSRSPNALQRLENEHRGAPLGRLRVKTLDLTQEDAVKRRFEELGQVDHVAITAVKPVYGPVRQLDMARVREVVDCKLFGPLHVAKHARFAPTGSLLLTAGIAMERPGPGSAPIAALNASLIGLMNALAVDLAPVRVNTVSPGWVDTPVWDNLAGTDKQRIFAQHAERLPVGRVGAPADIAQAAIGLMQNGFVNGSLLHVDGGHRLIR